MNGRDRHASRHGAAALLAMQYQYNEDYTERKAITGFIPPPSTGVRGEF